MLLWLLLLLLLLLRELLGRPERAPWLPGLFLFYGSQRRQKVAARTTCLFRPEPRRVFAARFLSLPYTISCNWLRRRRRRG